MWVRNSHWPLAIGCAIRIATITLFNCRFYFHGHLCFIRRSTLHRSYSLLGSVCKAYASLVKVHWCWCWSGIKDSRIRITITWSFGNMLLVIIAEIGRNWLNLAAMDVEWSWRRRRRRSQRECCDAGGEFRWGYVITTGDSGAVVLTMDIWKGFPRFRLNNVK